MIEIIFKILVIIILMCILAVQYEEINNKQKP